MSEDKEVNASDVINMVVEHLQDIANAKEMDSYPAMTSTYNHYKEQSYAKLQEKLDAYVDQRIMKLLDKTGLCKTINPMN